MSNQSGRIRALLEAGATETSYQGAWHSFWDSAGIAAGNFVKRMVLFLKDFTGLSTDHIVNLQGEYAKQLGVDSWNNIGYDELQNGLVSDYFYFNGTSQYASTPTGWTPNGFPFEIQISTNDALDTTQSVMFGGDTNNRPTSGYFVGLAFYQFEDVNNTNQQATVNSSITGSVAIGVGKTAVNFSVGGMSAPAVNAESKTVTGTPITHIGASLLGADLYQGVLRNVRLIDNSPIQDGDYQVGNGSIYGQLDTPVLCPRDFDISFEWVREQPSNSVVRMITDSTIPLFNHISIFAPDQATAPNRVQVQINGESAFNFDGALDDVELGQHFVFRLARVGSDVNLYVDEVAHPVTNTSSAPFRFDYIGAAWGGTNLFRGAIANLKVIADTEYLDGDFDTYDDTSAPGFIESFTGQSDDVAGMGSLVYGSANLDVNSNGFRITNNITADAVWNNAFVVANNLATLGYRMTFELEKGFFDQATTSWLGQFEYLLIHNSTAPTSILYDNNISAWGSIPADPASVKTAVDSVSGTHARVDISYTPGIGANGTGRIDLYIERTLVSQWSCPAGDTFPVDGSIKLNSNLGGLADLFNNQFRIRNVQISAGSIDKWGQTSKQICHLGDSFVQLGQYSLGSRTNDQGNEDPNHNPALNGIDNSVETTPMQAVNSPYWTAGFMGQLQGSLSEIGYYPQATNNQGSGTETRRVENYGEGGSRILSVGLPGLKERVDAALGVALNRGPAGGAADRQNIWIIDIGTNEIYADQLWENPQLWDQRFTDIEAVMRTELQRILDDGRTETIILGQVTKVWTDTGVDFVPAALYQRFDSLWAQLAQIDSRIIVVNVNDVWDYNTHVVSSGVHPNNTGFKLMADRMAASLKSGILPTGTYTFDFPFNEGSGLKIANRNSQTAFVSGSWTGENWTNIPDNTRVYRMNEGAGNQFLCEDRNGNSVPAGHMTIVDPSGTGGGWNYEP